MSSCENFDLSICTLQGNLCISGTKILLAKLISILKCNEKGQPFNIQIANDEYFSKLKIIGDDIIRTFPKAYKPVRFLENIQINEKFIIVLGNVNDDSSLNYYTEINKKIHEINGILFPFTVGEIAKFYNIYYWGDKRVLIGENDKTKRVCRFCGKASSSVTTFKQNAHAISESLGNKLLYCNEECDSCNASFSAIEQDFFNIHHLLFSLYQKKRQGWIKEFER